MGKGERPEHTAPPDIFYNEDEAAKYTCNSRMIAIQEALTKVCCCCWCGDLWSVLQGPSRVRQ
jgi:hypothetical protein